MSQPHQPVEHPEARNSPAVESPASIDYSQRPASYWSWPTKAFPNITGTARRRLVQRASDSGTLSKLPADLAKDRLSGLDLVQWGRVYPQNMGGEYLPELRAREVNIAYVCLASTTGDTIAIRARPIGDRIAYHVVDEYKEHGVYRCTPRTSRRPLTLAQLVRLIDTCEHVGWDGGVQETGLVHPVWKSECSGSTPADRVRFVTLDSAFYPQLSSHYRFDGLRFLASERSS